MKIQGLFLTSRAGRRIFWTLLAAATVPLLLFGAAVHDAFDDYSRGQAQRQRTQAAKYVGLGLLEKLLAARTVLATSASTGQINTLTEHAPKRGRPLREVTLLDNHAQVQAGSSALWERWRAQITGLYETDALSDARLYLGHAIAVDGRVPVLIALRDASDANQVWLAEIDADYLFGDLSADGAGAGVCVVDARGRALACPGGLPLSAATGSTPPSSAESDAAPSWRLFLRSDFGADDWVLVHGGAAADSSVATQTIARTMVLGLMAAMLVVALLSMGQVRRTMVPLERLIAGTRKLSRGEFTARVEHARADEFGELAHSFNHMAERIGQQVEAMHVQSAIDLEILNGLDVERILQRVAARLAVLVPSEMACVVELDRAVPALARAHRSDGTVLTLAPPPAEALGEFARESLRRWDVQPDWLQRAMSPWHGSVKVHGVHVGGRAIALLVLGVGDPRLDNTEARREIIELGDRVAVALTSAERERRLQERATRDSLTGLANRLGLFEQVEQRLNEPARQPFSLLYVDLDGFKDVNDAHGHATGDALLGAIAQRLSSLAGPGSLVARPGGDEFVLVVPGSCESGAAVAAKVVEQLGLPVTLPNRTVKVACSIGLAHHPEDGHSVSDLLRRADMAMYAAKAAGGRRSAWFDASMDARLAERTALLADLHLALHRDEFELHYQPRVTAEGGAVRCAEALLRWRRRGGELVPPARFIELLEDSGLIDAAGLWVVDEACRQLVAWRAAGTALETLSVNVSTRQLHAPAFAEQVLGIVRRHGLAPSDIELEITESVFIGDSSEAIARLRTLRDAGMGIALDDFGTGYSSLSYLHTLPITCLKVDRSFVSALGVRDSALALTRTIVALAGALKLEVVAEGVETPAQAKLLRELGCHRLQGFLYARALIAEDFARYWAQPQSVRSRAALMAQP